MNQLHDTHKETQMLCVAFLGGVYRSYRALQILASALACKLNPTFEEVLVSVGLPTDAAAPAFRAVGSCCVF